MAETETPTQEYRNNLARNLSELRQAGAKEAAKTVLDEEKQTHIYKLSEGLKKNKERSPIFGKKDYDDPKEHLEVSHNTVSNEASLYEVFPYIKDSDGAGMGVGLDQMLDIAVNSKLKEVYIVDVQPSVAITTRALLEIGRKHHKLSGKYPTPKEYIAYFDQRNVPATLQMLSTEFTKDELNILGKTLTDKVKASGEKTTEADSPAQVEHYLKFKNRQKDYKSWISDEKNLQQIITMYENGKIVSVMGDLTGKKSMPGIADDLRKRKLSLSLVYLSNAKYYFASDGTTKNFQKNLDSMPVNGKTVVVETSMGSMPIPDSVKSDLWMSKLMPMTWEYQIQNLADAEVESKGIYTAIDGGKTFALTDTQDRILAVDGGYKTAKEVGLVLPKKGLVVALK